MPISASSAARLLLGTLGGFTAAFLLAHSARFLLDGAPGYSLLVAPLGPPSQASSGNVSGRASLANAEEEAMLRRDLGTLNASSNSASSSSSSSGGSGDGSGNDGGRGGSVSSSSTGGSLLNVSLSGGGDPADIIRDPGWSATGHQAGQSTAESSGEQPKAPGKSKPARKSGRRWWPWKRRKGPSTQKTEEYLPNFFHAPYQSYVALCICTKEDLDIVEWVEYHKRIGVNVIYVFDHRSREPEFSLLKPYILEGFVVYNYLTHSSLAPSRYVYEHCVHAYGSRHRWMGFLDTDEFVVIPSEKKISEVLKDYEEFDGLVLNWRYIGSSGHTKRPKEGVLKSYSQCSQEGIPLVKTFANPAKVQKITNPHYATYKDGGFAVNVDKQKQSGPRNAPPLLKIMYINHYFLKSLEDFKAKVRRGNSGERKKLSTWYILGKRLNHTCPHLRMPGPEWDPPLGSLGRYAGSGENEQRDSDGALLAPPAIEQP